jgi:hypothetical protein
LKREEGAGSGTEEEGEVGSSEAGDRERERAGKVVVEEERKDRVREEIEMGSGRRGGRTHTGRARESSRVVLWASGVRGRTAELKLRSVSGVKRR